MLQIIAARRHRGITFSNNWYDLSRLSSSNGSDAIDAVRDELQWLMNSREEFLTEPRHVVQITSMPKDACAPDFGERVNRYTAKDLPPEETATSASVPAQTNAVQQRELWG